MRSKMKSLKTESDHARSGSSVCSNRMCGLSSEGNVQIQRNSGVTIHLSVVNGYVYLKQTSWNNFNESTDLIVCVKEYSADSAFIQRQFWQTRFTKQGSIRSTASCAAYVCRARPWAEKTMNRRRLRKNKCTVIPVSGIGPRERTVS